MSATIRTTAPRSTISPRYWIEDAVDAAEVDAVVADQVEAVVVPELRAEQQQRRVLEEERDAERRDQRRDPRRVAQRPVGEALDRDAEDARSRPSPPGTCRARAAPTGIAGLSGAAEQRQDAEADERADHVHVAVGEVEQLEDPVDHRVPERDQRVDAAEDDPVDRELEEERPALRRRRVDRVEVQTTQRMPRPPKFPSCCGGSAVTSSGILPEACGPPVMGRMPLRESDGAR